MTRRATSVAPPLTTTTAWSQATVALADVGGAGGRDVAQPTIHAVTMATVAPTLDRRRSLDDDDVMRPAVSVILPTLLLAGCAHDTMSTVLLPASAPMAIGPASLMPDAPILALQNVDAPGLSVEDLTARVRDGLVQGSGVIVVDLLDVQAELAACVEMPCPEIQQERFRNASLSAKASLSRVGPSVLGALRISRGLKEVARVNAHGTNAGDVATRLGREGGVALRQALLATPPPTVPEAVER